MVRMAIGNKGLGLTYQAAFPSETPCCRCDGMARIGLVLREDPPAGNGPVPFVCRLHENDPSGEGYWLHDCCAVAIYFCRKCLKPTALYNQA